MRIALVLVACFAMGGCASVTRGWTEQISIASSPSGAQATVSGSENHTCVTPCVVQVNRNSDIQVAFELAGYEPEIVVLTKELATTGAAGFAGNILLGGIIGMASMPSATRPWTTSPTP